MKSSPEHQRENITAKLAENHLKRVLYRRSQANAITELFDSALPEQILFHGLKAAPKKPSVREARYKDSLSPYIIHLRKTDRLAAESSKAVMVNLLNGYQYVDVEQPKSKFEQPPSLEITRAEIAKQIEEDALPNEALALVPKIHFSLPKLSLKTKASGLKAHKPIAKPFPLEELSPQMPPENPSEYFYLPEEEEAEDKAPLSIEEEPGFVYEEVNDEAEEDQAPIFPNLKQSWRKPLAAFVGMSFLFVLPLHAMSVFGDLKITKQSVDERSASALVDLEQGATQALSKDTLSAAGSFGSAYNKINEAQAAVEELGLSTNLILQSLPTNSSYKAGELLLEVGKDFAKAGKRISEGFTAMNSEINPTPTSKLALLTTYMEAALPSIEQADEKLKKVETSKLPEDLRESIDELKSNVPNVLASLQEFVSFSKMASTILGADGTKKYLAVFQNNTELRATGGFMGSFAELTVRDGEIVNIDIPGGGTYDLQGELRDYVAAPEALRLLSPRWEFQDANWFPDFPTSARQILQFWQGSGGPSVDGVIAVNATFIQDLLEILGPIEMPEYERTIDAENFLFETQKIVEIEYDREENKPKEFIGDLAPKLLERALEVTNDDYLSVLDILHQGLNERDVQMYFADDDLERRIRELGWAGELKWSEYDYLMVVDTNLGGGKTDGVIDENIELNIDIDDKGFITNTLTFKRTHYGISGSLFDGVNNVDYVRVYVPKGSKLLDAKGFKIPDEDLFELPLEEWQVDDDLIYSEMAGQYEPESKTLVYEESGKTVFGNWMQTKPGTSSEITFKYRLPFTIEFLHTDPTLIDQAKSFLGTPRSESYSLLVQKQSGVNDRDSVINISVPEELDVAWSTHDLTGIKLDNLGDGFIGLILAEKE